jgi:hypothetical protein
MLGNEALFAALAGIISTCSLVFGGSSVSLSVAKLTISMRENVINTKDIKFRNFVKLYKFFLVVKEKYIKTNTGITKTPKSILLEPICHLI